MHEIKSSRISSKIIIIRKIETGKNHPCTDAQEKIKCSKGPYDKDGVNKLVYYETQLAYFDYIEGYRFY